VFVTESGLPAPPPNAVAQQWVLDTGNTGDALAWRHHLLAAGLNPDAIQVGSVRIRSIVGAKPVVPIRSADLWLNSNIPALAATPFKLERSGNPLPRRKV
jgi:hypothetical protein